MNKNILIIGGSSGIGAALSNKLADQNNVYRASRTPSPMPGVTSIAYNVLENDLDLQALPDTLEGLVYCPGSINLRPFKGLKPDTFRSDFELNLIGAVRTLQRVLPKLQQATASSIVFFSTVAVQTGMPYHASVAAAKGAIEGLTRSLAAELAPSVRVNAIAPSLVNTPLADKFLNSQEKIERAGERHPLQRVGTPEEIAALAAFLLSEEAAWMTGQILTADGGIGTLKS